MSLVPFKIDSCILPDRFRICHVRYKHFLKTFQVSTQIIPNRYKKNARKLARKKITFIDMIFINPRSTKKYLWYENQQKLTKILVRKSIFIMVLMTRMWAEAFKIMFFISNSQPGNKIFQEIYHKRGVFVRDYNLNLPSVASLLLAQRPDLFWRESLHSLPFHLRSDVSKILCVTRNSSVWISGSECSVFWII